MPITRTCTLPKPLANVRLLTQNDMFRNVYVDVSAYTGGNIVLAMSQFASSAPVGNG